MSKIIRSGIEQGIENKTRRNFAFLPVSQVRTNTFFIVYFLENLFSDNRFMWNCLRQKSQNNIGPFTGI